MKPQVEALQSSVLEEADGAISARVADECDRALGQELSPDEGEMRAGLVRDGEMRELAPWGKFDVYTQRNACHVSKKVAQTRRVLTRKMIDGTQCVMARLPAKGFRDPGLQEGPVDTPGCVSLR